MVKPPEGWSVIEGSGEIQRAQALVTKLLTQYKYEDSELQMPNELWSLMVLQCDALSEFDLGVIRNQSTDELCTGLENALDNLDENWDGLLGGAAPVVPTAGAHSPRYVEAIAEELWNRIEASDNWQLHKNVMPLK